MIKQAFKKGFVDGVKQAKKNGLNIEGMDLPELDEASMFEDAQHKNFDPGDFDIKELDIFEKKKKKTDIDNILDS